MIRERYPQGGSLGEEWIKQEAEWRMGAAFPGGRSASAKASGHGGACPVR